MTFKESPEWELGQWGEIHVRRWLERSGKFVVPTSCIEDGGAPALTRLLQRLVLPDYQTFDSNGGGWWEVKTKTRAMLYQKANEWRTGVDLRLWNAYREVEQATQLPGHLVMIHLNPKELHRKLLVARMDDLVAIPHSGSTTSYGGSELVFFRIDDFDRVTFTASGPQLPPHIEPKIVRPWEVDKPMGEPQLPLWTGSGAI